MTISFLTDQTAPRLRAFAERVVDVWNHAHPEQVVDLTTIDHELLKQEVGARLTSPTPPDVITMTHNGWYAGNRTGSRAPDGLMMNIADLWESEGFGRTYADAFQRIARAGNGVLFLPTSYYWWAVFYRPSVFESAGVPAPIETWSELVTAARVFQSAGVAPFALGVRDRCPAAAWFDYLDMRANGPAFHDRLMLLQESYLDDRVRSVFARWRTLMEDGWFAGDPMTYGEEESVDLLRRGEAAMVLIGAYVTDEYAADLEPDLDFFRFPVIDPALGVGEDAPVDGYFAAGNSVNPEAARRFLAFLGSREVQQLAIDELSALPTRTDVDCGRASPIARRGIETVGAADQLFQFYNLDTPTEIADVGMRAFVSFLRDPGGIDARLREVEEMRLELLRQGA